MSDMKKNEMPTPLIGTNVGIGIYFLTRMMPEMALFLLGL
jgi:hypothetical protein